jgi:hypothetical protein
MSPFFCGDHDEKELLFGEDCAATGATHAGINKERIRRRGSINPSWRIIVLRFQSCTKAISC